ncbi:hypothetical protein A2U01_0084391, partial [Trifolium medium]|nr:hypothetical protein [Trifolium medium]
MNRHGRANRQTLNHQKSSNSKKVYPPQNVAEMMTQTMIAVFWGSLKNDGV